MWYVTNMVSTTKKEKKQNTKNVYTAKRKRKSRVVYMPARILSQKRSTLTHMNLNSMYTSEQNNSLKKQIN